MSTPDLTDPRWTKSSYSEPSGNCVELATTNTAKSTAVRDSKLERSGPSLTFSHDQIQAFIHGVKNNEFNHHPN